MATVKVGINGLGRIGRTLFREIQSLGGDLEVVAVNNPGDIDTFAHLISYDSVHGKYPHDISVEGSNLVANGRKTAFLQSFDPSELPWSDLGVDIVIDSTGRFTDVEGLSKHLGGSVKKVILCAPGKDVHGTFVMGINHDEYDPSTQHIVSNASCTTNCLAPMAKVLHEKWGILNGFMTTVHSYTSDQQLLDGSHKDLRRARAASLSMVPTTTGAAKAVGLVFPELKGKLDGYAIRVPTPNVSLVDLTVNLGKSVTKEEVNAELKRVSENELKGILKVCDLSLVSTDYVGMKESSCIDSQLTNVMENNVKVISWYDNEMGFSSRVIDLAKFIASKF
jgi:glyceraldehyde 3-phosphate dehydrogenase